MQLKHPPCPTVSFGVSVRGRRYFRSLDLPLALHHLIEERQAGDEADHRDEPGRARMRLDERIDAVESVDACRVFEIGAVRILMAFAETHQGLVRPGIIVEHGDFDDPRLDDRCGCFGCRIELLQLGEQVIGLDLIRIELDLIGCVGRTDLGHALDPSVAHRIGDEEALEESLQRHGLSDFGEDVLIAAVGKSGLHD